MEPEITQPSQDVITEETQEPVAVCLSCNQPINEDLLYKCPICKCPMHGGEYSEGCGSWDGSPPVRYCEACVNLLSKKPPVTKK